MTIDEAIQNLELVPPIFFARGYENYNDAIKLGIEALKLVKDKRGYPEYIIPHRLSGEER